MKYRIIKRFKYVKGEKRNALFVPQYKSLFGWKDLDAFSYCKNVKGVGFMDLESCEEFLDKEIEKNTPYSEEIIKEGEL